MKRVALIDNLNHIDRFRKYQYEEASIHDIVHATGGNTGNVAFVYAIEKIIGNKLTRINWGWDKEVVKKRFDHIVICAANQIGSHVDLAVWGDRIADFGLPVSVIGIGAQADSLDTYPVVPEGTLHFLRQISLHSEGSVNISVRGNFTSDVLKKLNFSSCKTGCPTLLISNDKDLGRHIAQRKNSINKIAVAAGNIWHKKSAVIERILCDVVDEYNGSYILQHPLSMLQIAFNEKKNIEKDRIKIFLERYGNRFNFTEMLEWMRRNAFLFIDSPNWMRFLSHYDGVIGPRYHGVALGIQTGIPGFVIEIDSRTAELSRETKVKSYRLEDIRDLDSHGLASLISWSKEEGEIFDINRKEKAILMIEFLENNGLLPSEHLKKLSV